MLEIAQMVSLYLLTRQLLMGDDEAGQLKALVMSVTLGFERVAHFSSSSLCCTLT